MSQVASSARHTDQSGRTWVATAVARLRLLRAGRAAAGDADADEIEVLIRFCAGSEERFARAHDSHWRSPGRLRRLFRSARPADTDRVIRPLTASAA